MPYLNDFPSKQTESSFILWFHQLYNQRQFQQAQTKREPDYLDTYNKTTPPSNLDNGVQDTSL